MTHTAPRGPGRIGVFDCTKPLVGMVHLLPLPGAPRWEGSMGAVVERAVEDARALEAGGMDGVIVENFLDAPFFSDRVPPETVAAITRVTGRLLDDLRIPVGVNVLRNDATAALAVAAATGAHFIRVNVHTGSMWTDQGWIQGHAERTLRDRARLGAHTAILADVFVKHASPPPGLTIEDAARDCWERGLADGLIVTGSGTGEPTDAGSVAAVRAAVPDSPIWVGSGATPATVASLLSAADGIIVGSALCHDGQAGSGIDPRRVGDLVEAARR